MAFSCGGRGRSPPPLPSNRASSAATASGDRRWSASCSASAKALAASITGSTRLGAGERQRAGAHRRAAMMLRGGDQRDRHALVGAEAGAAERVIFDLARGRGPHRPDPAGKLGHRALRPLGAERTSICVPAGLPAGDVASVVAGEPAAKPDADQPLRPGLRGGGTAAAALPGFACRSCCGCSSRPS